MVRRRLTELPARPAAAMIDAHNHLGRWLTGTWSVPDMDALVATMDEVGVEAVVNLDGMWGEELEANLDRYDRAHPGRFATFAQWDRRWFELDAWDELGAQARASFASGARGLKVWKDLGLHLRDGAGALVMPDDPRLEPVWDAVAEAGVPVTIHIADPSRSSSRSTRATSGWRSCSPIPTGGSAMRTGSRDSSNARIARVADRPALRHHVDRRACALQRRGRRVDPPDARRPIRTHTPISRRGSRSSAACRERRASCLSIIPIVSCSAPTRSRRIRSVYAVHRRFFETADEDFPYDPDPEEPPSQGRWTISGLELPDDVLEQLYSGNARRLIPGLAR